MINRVCVYASACDYLEKIYYEEAAKLGTLLAQNGFEMVYGGSKLGLMWACAGAHKHNNGKLYAVMPEKLYDGGVTEQICDEFFLTPGMRERKAKMDELSDAFIALPGGFGTLEEISEIIVQKQLCYNNKAIVFVNTNGFYDRLIGFMDEIIRQKFAKANSHEIYYIANTPEDAVKHLQNYNPEARVFEKESYYKR